MKPAPFDYVRAESVEHAVATLAAAGSDGKIIAGGQSLMPMINFRLVRPAVLVDINRISGLDRIEDRGKHLRLGALVRHRMTASDAVIARDVPVLHAAMENVAHLTVRNRGTFCGSVCHADPAAEMPMLTLLLDGVVRIAGPNGEREIAAADFLTGSLTNALDPAEMVTAIDIAKPAPGTGWGFAEFARRHGDYALAAVSVLIERADGAARNVRVAVMGVGEIASRIAPAEAALEGREPTAAVIAEAVVALRSAIEPMSDLSASADYRRHLAGALVAKVIAQAWERAA
ncbi:xanthine dehydrogenase family protein subunit M [Novosphingobium sp. PASSN1]|uniref:FAD binding domain-containing protein n=1 Tax=Novosphingobium sp. PASSN1 TaxID=2015561 RepID=UPI000BC93B86|nr:xanthine dehydrogenase family protein subunit M [Novosphingobium sp. PASSN1]OYU35704.1 MAG: carbon monoxide dehydrogenase [Novosphingobium sp. PASSN1]